VSNFADRLLNAIDEKHSFLVAGIDPSIEQLPRCLLKKANNFSSSEREAAGFALSLFGRDLIDAVKEYVVGVKIQMAYFEVFGYHGIKAFEEVARYARQAGLLVIADGKRGDIGSTALAYAQAYLHQESDIDALTVNPYLGSDSVQPFIDRCSENKGVFILVKTSNKSSQEFQDLICMNRPLYQHVGEAVCRWSKGLKGEHGYSSVGAVVGATFPKEMENLRTLMPQVIFLVPGFGAQGGSADDVIGAFDTCGYGAIVNSSRGIMYAYINGPYTEDDYQQAQKEAAETACRQINLALEKAERLPLSFGKS
jgi:orotidine-5'-phosphate decarboxylase